MFDFKIVQRQIITAYRRVDIESWSLEEVIDFFAMYYSKYQQATGREHPRLTTATIEKIISELPYLYIRDEYRCCGYMKGIEGYDRSLCEICKERECCGDMVDGLTLEDYEKMMDAYFKQDFPNCDYSLAHFMSGDIRLVRFYEACY